MGRLIQLNIDKLLNEGQLCDVVLVYHAHHWLLLNCVHLRISQVNLLACDQFPLNRLSTMTFLQIRRRESHRLNRASVFY